MRLSNLSLVPHARGPWPHRRSPRIRIRAEAGPSSRCRSCRCPLSILAGESSRRHCLRCLKAAGGRYHVDVCFTPIVRRKSWCEAHRHGWEPCLFPGGCPDFATPRTKTSLCRRHQNIAYQRGLSRAAALARVVPLRRPLPPLPLGHVLRQLDVSDDGDLATVPRGLVQDGDRFTWEALPDEWFSPRSLELMVGDEIVGGFGFEVFARPRGRVLSALGTWVHPSRRCEGLGRLLWECALALVQPRSITVRAASPAGLGLLAALQGAHPQIHWSIRCSRAAQKRRAA